MNPLISCLMITKDRPAFVRRSVEFFIRQSWPEKDLLVVVDGRGEAQDASAEYLRSLGRRDITVIRADGPFPRARLRNIAVEAAAGDVLCQWDDDDFHHPRRLELQLSQMEESGADACFFYDILNYFEDTGELFWTDWSFRRGGETDLGASQTMMCRRSARVRYPEDPESNAVGEDAGAQIDLYRRCRVAGLSGFGFLYAYVYHGGNVMSRKHHRMIVDWMCTRREFVEARIGSLTRHVREYFPTEVRRIFCRDGVSLPLKALD